MRQKLTRPNPDFMKSGFFKQKQKIYHIGDDTLVIVIETDSISGHTGIPINSSQLEAAKAAADMIGLERIVVVSLNGALDGLDISVACPGYKPGHERFDEELWKIQSEFKKRTNGSSLT